MTSPVVVHIGDPPSDRERVYIGRAVPRRRFSASMWGNPFRVGPDGDGPAVLAKYRAHVLASPDLVALPSLEGAELACWCRHRGESEPPCHGDVLIALFNEYEELHS